jgi:hypothetical protein
MEKLEKWLLLPASCMPDENGMEESRSPTQEIKYKNKVVLALQGTIHYPWGRQDFVVVPGYKASKPFRYSKNIRQVKIKRIPPSEQENIRKMLQKKKFKGSIGFW